MSSENLNNLVINTDYLSTKDEEIIKAQSKKEKISLTEGASIVLQDQLIPSLFRLANKESLEPDYNFRFTEESFKDLTDGVNEDYWDEFGNASSLENAYQIKRRILDAQENNKKLATLGYTGVGLSVASALLDPGALVADGVTFGLARPFIYANRASRISKYIRSGAVGAGQAGLITAPTILADPTRDAEEIGIAMGLGGAVTAGLTKFLAPKHPIINKFDAKSVDFAKSIERRSLENDGYKITPDGERYFKPIKYVDLNRNTDEIDEVNKLQNKFIFSNKSKYIENQNIAKTKVKDFIKGDETLENFFDRVDKTPDVANPLFLPRIDKSSIGRRSDNPLARSLYEKLAEEPVGNKDYSVQIPTADIHKKNYYTTKITQFYKGYRPGLNEYLDSQKKFFKRYNYKTQEEFSNLVGRAIRGENIQIPAVQKAAVQSKVLLKNILDDLKAAKVQGATDVIDNPNYFPRKYLLSKIQKYTELVGETNLIKFLKNSLVKGSKDLSDEKGLKIAEHILKMIKKSKYGDGISIDRILNTSDELELRELIRTQTDLNDLETNDLVKTLLKEKKTNVPSRLRRRASFDELHQENINGVTLRFSDLLDNNAEGIIGSYLQQFSGHIALARVGIKSVSDYSKILNTVRQAYDVPEVANAYQSVLGSARINRELNIIDTIYKNIIGIPTETDINSGTALIARNVRKYNYVNVFNQIGFSQIPDHGNILATAGPVMYARYMPLWKSIIKRTKDGKLSDEFLDEMETFVSGTGSNRLTSSILNRTDDFAGINKRVGGVEKAFDVFSEITSDGSGFYLVDTLSKRLATTIAFNKLAKHATGELALKADDLKRYRNIGFTDEDLTKIFDSVKKNSTFIEGGLTGRRIRRLNIDDWKDQDLANKLSLNMGRYLGRIVQENNYGEMIGYLKLADSTLGKTLMQFRTFVSVAYSKQLLHGLHMRDLNFFTAFFGSMFFASLAYVAQIYAQAAGKGTAERQNFLEEKLDPASIAKATFQRSTYSTLIPPAVDALRYANGFDPIFNYRTSGLDINLWTGNPTVSLFNNAANAYKGVASSVSQDDYDLSKRDVYNVLRILPFQNMLGVRNVLQYMIDESDLPEFSE